MDQILDSLFPEDSTYPLVVCSHVNAISIFRLSASPIFHSVLERVMLPGQAPFILQRQDELEIHTAEISSHSVGTKNSMYSSTGELVQKRFLNLNIPVGDYQYFNLLGGSNDNFCSSAKGLNPSQCLNSYLVAATRFHINKDGGELSAV